VFHHYKIEPHQDRSLAMVTFYTYALRALSLGIEFSKFETVSPCPFSAEFTEVRSALKWGMTSHHCVIYSRCFEKGVEMSNSP
jgi:hypothetical protein